VNCPIVTAAETAPPNDGQGEAAIPAGSVHSTDHPPGGAGRTMAAWPVELKRTRAICSTGGEGEEGGVGSLGGGDTGGVGSVG